jgi:hypothetical protein
LSTRVTLPIEREMSTVLMMGIVLIAASVVVLVWAFPTHR